jgi:hypothetical protein
MNVLISDTLRIDNGSRINNEHRNINNEHENIRKRIRGLRTGTRTLSAELSAVCGNMINREIVSVKHVCLP